MPQSNEKGLNLNAKSFITATIIIFMLMVAAFVLTMVIPGGAYERTLDSNGNLVIDTTGSFSYIDGGIPFWKWLLSPILVLGAPGNGTIIAVILFLLVIGGVFNCLERCGLTKYMLDKITHRFANVRYQLMAVITLFFMALGSAIGSYEESVPLVPIVVALAVNLGWDSLTGVGMSLLAVGCGFAAGVCNPFTVGVAQQLAGLPMFSGASMRILAFVLIYILLLTFIYLHAKKVEQPLTDIQSLGQFTQSKEMEHGLRWFLVILGAGILVILCSGFIPAIQDYTMIIVALMFLLSGTVSCLVSGMDKKVMIQTAFQGVQTIFPAVLMILMASSIKFTLEEAHILDTILHAAVTFAGSLPKWALILFIYLIVLILNFCIPSGSAKAFMLIPLIVPMAQIFGISAQLCVLAFAFGDGFSNVLYPTNPVLLISLGVANISYSEWIKWSWKFQILNLALTSGLLLFGLVIGY